MKIIDSRPPRWGKWADGSRMGHLNRTRLGFSLVEVVVSVMIIAMMMTSLLTFVSYGGEIWQRNHLHTSLNNEGIMLLDAVEREMSMAVAVSIPAVGDATGDVLRYKKDVYDWAGPPRNKATTPEFRFYLQPGTRIVSSQYVTGTLAAPDTTTAGWAVQTTDPAGNEVKKLVTKLFDYDLARHVLTFDVTRRSTNRVEVRIVLNLKRAQDGLEQRMEMKRDMMIPGL